jgi:hypothetical protein
MSLVIEEMRARADYNFKVGVPKDIATCIIPQLAVRTATGALKAISAQQDYLIGSH